jgi:hypothetical protein
MIIVAIILGYLLMGLVSVYLMGIFNNNVDDEFSFPEELLFLAFALWPVILFITTVILFTNSKYNLFKFIYKKGLNSCKNKQ